MPFRGHFLLSRAVRGRAFLTVSPAVPDRVPGIPGTRPGHPKFPGLLGTRLCSLATLTKTYITLCYTIVLPGRKSAFRAGFWPDCYREKTEIGPPAGLRPAGGPMSVLSR